MICASSPTSSQEGWVNIVGGCCGTTPADIREFAAAAEGKKPRRPGSTRNSVSGIELMETDVENRPVLVGERTNVLGSRKFKRLVAEESSRRRPTSPGPRSKTARRSSTFASRTRTAMNDGRQCASCRK